MTQSPDSPKLRDYIWKYYKEAHENGTFTGTTYIAYLEILARIVPNIQDKLILDYGCGNLGGLSNQYPLVKPFDPYVQNYQFDPWAVGCEYDVIFSADVLEHMTIPTIGHFLKKASVFAKEYIFLAISVKISQKHFSNGVSIHTIIEPPAFWQGFLQGLLYHNFDMIYANHDLLEENFVICFKRHIDDKVN